MSVKRILNQLFPPDPNSPTEEELEFMAAPLSAAEQRQEDRERQAKRMKNQRSRQWWNHR
jgi:hypothetical protein